ncbi:MAG: molybdopterin molybdotransferase MoeA [Leptolyngbyaceae cyanobacterium RM1_406_9]|nr:molybdopterin molybdotransferase MoeA [Leptolyngbyaceae cyanobacterium RM1_406_9]
MLPAQQAEDLILSLVKPLNAQQNSEMVNLLAASGRILAEAVIGQLDFPHWDNSAMDGYAVRFDDVQACTAESPAVLQVIEEIPAGYVPQKTVQAGQAVRILTGSMMPAGADTVVIQEVTKREGDRLSILSAPQPQAFVRHRATFYQSGTPLLPAGVTLSAPEIAVLAAAQCTQVRVYRRPRVAILSTGSELVEPDQPLQPGQIVDSNQYALAALVAQSGAEPLLLGIVPDQPEALKGAIANAISTADLVLSSGGVSVGDYDYVDRILADLGAQLHIRAVAVKPGKPLTVATFQKHQISESAAPILYFGLPGNPVSALVSFWRFVQPALRKLSGQLDGWRPVLVEGRSLHPLKSDGKRESYLWGTLHLINGAYEFHLAAGSHSSGNLINLAQTNALAVVPVGQTLILAGDSIQIMQVGSPCR